MVEIQSVAAEIRRGKKRKKKDRNHRMKIYMVSLLHRATIKNTNHKIWNVVIIRYLPEQSLVMFCTGGYEEDATRGYISSDGIDVGFSYHIS